MKGKLTLIISTLIVLTAVVVASFAGVTPVNASPSTVYEVGPKGRAMTFDNLSLYSTSEYGTYFDTVNHKPNGVAPEDNGEYSNELLHPYSVVPTTYEAWIKLPAGLSEIGGCILGNYKNSSTVNWDFRIEANGVPKLYHLNYYNSSTDKDLNNIAFSGVNVATGKFLHLALIDDVSSGEFRCYVDGNLVKTITMTDAQRNHERKVPPLNTVLGGDMRAGNTLFFKGEISSVTIYSDVRTEDEIKSDMTSVDLSDPALISHYDCEFKQGMRVIPDLAGNYDMAHNRNNSEWVSTDQVEPLEPFDYSIAILGDQQIITGYTPEHLHYFGDWFLANKEEQKLAYILNVGDMTNFNRDEEWPLIRDEYARYDGEIPYALVRGDHDILAKDRESAGQSNEDGKNLKMFHETFINTPYASTVEGWCEDLTNSYRRVTLGTRNTPYLIITIDKNASPAVRAWAADLIANNPDHRVIITTHCYISCNGDPYVVGNESTLDSVSGRYKVNGETLFNELVKPFDNVDFFISGHVYSRRVVWSKRVSDTGNVCNQINVNPQGPGLDREGACGLVGMLYFSEDGSDVQVRYYSTVWDKYCSKVSQFSINTEDTADKVYAVVEDREQEMTDAVFTAAKVTGIHTGDPVSVPVTYTDADGIEKAIVRFAFDPSKLEFVSASGTGITSSCTAGNITVTYEGAELGASGTLCTLNFNAVDITEASPALISPKIVSLSAENAGVKYEFDGASTENGLVGVTASATVTYNEGDDFKTKIEQAIEYSRSFDVTFVLKNDYTADADAVFGSVSDIPAYKITVSSEDPSYPKLLHTGGHTLVFAGNFIFDEIKVGGAGTTAANCFFFPNGASGSFGGGISNLDEVVTTWNTTTYTGRPNVAGQNVEVASGYWCVVAGNLNQSAYTVPISDPKVVIRGSASVSNAAGSGYLGSPAVSGSTDIRVIENAVIGRYLAAGIYATTGNVGNVGGKLLIDTTGRVNTAAGCVVNKANTSSECPEYEITVNKGTVSALKGVHLISSATNVKIRYNVHIVINDGTFSGLVIGGLQTAAANTGCRYIGSSLVEIKGGSFANKIFGGSYLQGAGGVIGEEGEEHSSRLIIDIGNTNTLDKDVFGGSAILDNTCTVRQSSSLEIVSGSFSGTVSGGSYGDKLFSDTDENDHITGGFGQIGNVSVNIRPGAGTFSGKNSLTGYGVNIKGEADITVAGGTFSTLVGILSVDGSTSDVYKSTSVNGNVRVYIKGGVFDNRLTASIGASNMYGKHGYNVINGYIFWEITGGKFSTNFNPNGAGSAYGDVYVKFAGGSNIDLDGLAKLYVNSVSGGNQANNTNKRVLDLSLWSDEGSYEYFCRDYNYATHAIGSSTNTASFTVVYPSLYDATSVTVPGITDRNFSYGDQTMLFIYDISATFANAVKHSGSNANANIKSVDSYSSVPYADLIEYDVCASKEEYMTFNSLYVTPEIISKFVESADLVAGDLIIPLSVSNDGGKAEAAEAAASGFDYLGASIRPIDSSLRVRAYVTEDLRDLSLDNNGYKINRYGFIVSKSQTNTLTLGADNTKALIAYDGEKDTYYNEYGNYTFAAVVTNIPVSGYGTKINFMPFVEFVDEYGVTCAVYADTSSVANFIDSDTGNICLSLYDAAVFIKNNDYAFYDSYKDLIDDIIAKGAA